MYHNVSEIDRKLVFEISQILVCVFKRIFLCFCLNICTRTYMKLKFFDIWISGKTDPQNRVGLYRKYYCTCLKTSSSSRLLLSSTCLRPLSSASLIRLCLSANIEKAWIRRSSCRRISSLLRKSNMSPRLWPSTFARASSTRDSWNHISVNSH